ncbi:MAG: hypothetical protein JWP14_259 [Frankiales bacterium]|jgi:hypothetical protein|nr:hypothetical protein [Frankiales bacterium]
MDERRRRQVSAVLLALAWPVPVYGVVGSALVVVNEHLLHRHVFRASDIAASVALSAMLLAAWWSERQERIASLRS